MDTDNISQPIVGCRSSQFKKSQPVIHRKIILTFLLSTYLLVTLLHTQSNVRCESDIDDSSAEVDSCEACKLVVNSFEKGLEETSRGKHEGGDTSWEEKNLKNYVDSEVRLVEIQERLCEDVKRGKLQCLSLAEETESDVEEWWFKQRNKNVRLLDYLCISKLKTCCASNSFGPNCQTCPSDCNKHGVCDGAGTRLGTGKCLCESSYSGEECEYCASNHFRIATSGHHFTCQKCDQACDGCYGFGKTNCTECRSGYYKHETSGCIDINECDVGFNGNMRLCKGNSYCVNTDGAYRCEQCHISCSGCVGYGPNMCLGCAIGYQLDDDYTCRTEEELDRLREWSGDTDTSTQGKMARYFFYAGVMGVTIMMFRTNFNAMLIFTVVFIIMLVRVEYGLLDSTREYSQISSE